METPIIMYIHPICKSVCTSVIIYVVFIFLLLTKPFKVNCIAWIDLRCWLINCRWTWIRSKLNANSKRKGKKRRRNHAYRSSVSRSYLSALTLQTKDLPMPWKLLTGPLSFFLPFFLSFLSFFLPWTVRSLSGVVYLLRGEATATAGSVSASATSFNLSSHEQYTNWSIHHLLFSVSTLPFSFPHLQQWKIYPHIDPCTDITIQFFMSSNT